MLSSKQMQDLEADKGNDMVGVFLIVFAVAAVLSIGFAIAFITYDKKQRIK